VDVQFSDFDAGLLRRANELPNLFSSPADLSQLLKDLEPLGGTDSSLDTKVDDVTTCESDTDAVSPTSASPQQLPSLKVVVPPTSSLQTTVASNSIAPTPALPTIDEPASPSSLAAPAPIDNASPVSPSSLTTPTPIDDASPFLGTDSVIGSRITKLFDGVPHSGVVVDQDIDKEHGDVVFGVHYDDGDTEDFTRSDLVPFLTSDLRG
jgi:hypothetical protein